MFLKYNVSGQVPIRADRHRLAGTITVDGVPARRLVVVFDRATMVLLAAKWSDPTTGAWQISGLPQYAERQLLVMSVDHTGNYNAEVADYISQVTAVPTRLWTPADTSTEMWLDAADSTSIVSDANGISQWSDKSGKGRHAIQLNSARRPSLVDGAVLFDESDEFLEITSPLQALQSIFVVMETVDLNYILFGSGSENSFGLCGQDTSYAVSANFGTNVYYLDGLIRADWTARSIARTALNNRLSIVEIAGVTQTSWAKLTISGYSDSYPDHSFLGKVKEVISLQSVDTLLRDLTVGYLAWKHGTQQNLSSTHPYKNGAPVVAL